jgi:AmmeMemoRadiSam system protein A
VAPEKEASGDFSRFGAPQVRMRVCCDSALRDALCALAEKRSFPAGKLGPREAQLDHGTLVPLFFVNEVYTDYRLLRVGLSGLPLSAHYAFGQLIREAVEATGRRAVFIASGDLSHRLQENGPYGFAPEGPVYDRRVMDVCSRAAFGELLDFEEDLCERAAECGHRSFVIMAGALDGLAVHSRALSHEDVTGVGYGICMFTPGEADSGRRFLEARRKAREEQLRQRREREDSHVRLARETIERYVRTGELTKVPQWVPQQMRSGRAGVFVSLHMDGELRGCIGTFLPVRGSIAEEIIANAVSASTEDPRFPPVRPEELDRLEISVDVLSSPERVDSREELDPKRYGIIVRSGNRRGLLLPDLEGVDTVEQQISIAMKKAGISPRQQVTLERFQVVRHR